jgi:hypothetical protein
VKRDYRIWIGAALLVLVAMGLSLALLAPRAESEFKPVSSKSESSAIKVGPIPKTLAPLKQEPGVEPTSNGVAGENSHARRLAPATNKVAGIAAGSQATAQQAPPKPGKEPPRDPAARFALGLVGIDPLAEDYWISAINDSTLSAGERQDLIEDLNEDGLFDPKGRVPEDLPLIINRILLIEQLAPFAIDQVNADAFQEAYKDLVNLADSLMADVPGR